MANFKRRKPRSKVRCSICSSGRSSKLGNPGRGGRANDRRTWPTLKEQEA